MTTISPRLYNRNEPRAREVEAFLLANRDNDRGSAHTYAADYADATCTRALVASYFDIHRGRSIAFGANVARVLYDGSIYVEGAATNLALRSDDLTHAAWTATNCTVAASAELGIDGAACAGLVSFVGRGTSTSDQVLQSITVSADTNYVVSAFARRESDLKDAVPGLWFDTDGGTPSDLAATGKWRRSSFWGNSGTPSSPEFGLVYRDGDAPARVLVDGFQLEAGSFPTSPIATAGTAVTRPADVVSLADGDWDTDICTAAWEFDVWPDFASDELTTDAFLFGTNASADVTYLYAHPDGLGYRLAVYDGGVAKSASSASMTFSRGQKLTFRLDPVTGAIVQSGGTTGNGTNTTTQTIPWAWAPGAALAVSSATYPFYGRVSRPRLITP
jgi:hypothetical protein